MLANGTYTRDIPALPSLDTSAVGPTQSRGVYPQFFMKPSVDKKASKEAGRQIYRDVEFVKILVAGDAKTECEQKVTDDHRLRWPHHYEQFKRGLEQVVEGTPLEEWPQIGRSQAINLKVANILTVEHLAEVPDTALQSLGMGARDLRAKARAYIERAKDSAAADRQAAENQALKDQIALLQAQISEMQERFGDAGDAPAKRGPGRPRKEVNDG